MPNKLFLPLREPIGPSHDVDPVDVVVTKRSLSRLGYFDDTKYGLTPFPDKQLFKGIRSFQRDKKLTADGVIKPEGPTAQEISSALLLPPDTSDAKVENFSKTAGSSRPTPEQCDHLFYKVDVPVCRAIQRRRGKRAAANCYHSAAARYAACLHGVQIEICRH